MYWSLMGKAIFIFLWFLFFAVTYAALSFAGAAPAEVKILNGRIIGLFERLVGGNYDSSIAVSVKSLPSAGTDSSRDFFVSEGILPERIIIKKIGVDSPIINPVSTEIAVLDQALADGVVRYPGSGGLDDKSNMLLFGHSTPLRDVRNASYRAFNGLDKMTLGDTVEIWSGSAGYVYQVKSIYQADKDDALIEFNKGESMITLSTCDSFGSKADRIVVEARLVQVLP